MHKKNQVTQLSKLSFIPRLQQNHGFFGTGCMRQFQKAGISADLEAMKEVGIGGAYLMPIQDTLSTIPFSPTVRQLTPEWWYMVKFAMQEAKRLDLKLAMHVSDGFALAGGPWITPELSMQKIVWTKTYVSSSTARIKLAKPEANENFYKDVAVFAYPANSTEAFC